MNDVTTWINAHPFLAAALGAALGWLLRHRGIGSTLFPGLAPAPAKKSEPAVPNISPPMSFDSVGDPDHPALNVLRAGIDAGAAKEVMPAVEKLIAPKA